jgi:hypothetical protein
MGTYLIHVIWIPWKIPYPGLGCLEFLRFSVAEVRISADTNELCDKLIEAFRELKIQRISHSETLHVSVALAVVEQAFEEF